MKVVSTSYRQHTAQVQDIWEIRLSPPIMNQLRQIARKRKTTMSWLVRYCVFKLVNKKHIKRDYIEDLKSDIKESQPVTGSTMRFFLCLYGDDILLIKLRAASMNLTVSMFIRIALHRYLGIIGDSGRVPDWRLFWFGLKLRKKVLIHRWRKNYVHAKEFLNSQPFLKSDYWRIPEGPLPTFLTSTA